MNLLVVAGLAAVAVLALVAWRWLWWELEQEQPDWLERLLDEPREEPME